MSGLYSAADYGSALAALRPRGRAWPDEASSGQLQVLAACAPSYARVDAAAQSLLVDAFPATADALLVEWEQSCSLPDPALGLAPTTTQRRGQVLTRITGLGGQSAANFIAYAAQLGFTIAIGLFAPFRCGLNLCGDPLGGHEWSLAWSVTIIASDGVYSAEALLAELKNVAPAETFVFLQG